MSIQNNEVYTSLSKSHMQNNAKKKKLKFLIQIIIFSFLFFLSGHY